MSKMPLDYVIKNGKLYNPVTHEYAIIITSGYGSGWSSYCTEEEYDLARKRLFSPALAKALISGNKIAAKRAVLRLDPGLQQSKDLRFREQQLEDRISSLCVVFVNAGCLIKVVDYDGRESYECIPCESMYYAG